MAVVAIVATVAPAAAQEDDQDLPPLVEPAVIAPELPAALDGVALRSPGFDDALAAHADAAAALDALPLARREARAVLDRAERSLPAATAAIAVAGATIQTLEVRIAELDDALAILSVEAFVGTGARRSLDDVIGPSAAPAVLRRGALTDGVARTLLADRSALLDRLAEATQHLADATATERAARSQIEAARAGVDRLDAAQPALVDQLDLARRRLESERRSAEVVGADFPLVALDAYWRAARDAQARGCDIRWWALAAIGRVESRHGTFGPAELAADGRTTSPIVGVPLDGTNGTLLVPDSDGGALDRDTTYDRAVGPMQFIPTTWALVGRDGDGDGVADPHDLHDAAASAAVYLCDRSIALTGDAGLRTAYLAYNRSATYVETVLRFARAYEAALTLPAN